jgi:branched-chain amino acid transport system substrate-binding protein
LENVFRSKLIYIAFVSILGVGIVLTACSPASAPAPGSSGKELVMTTPAKGTESAPSAKASEKAAPTEAKPSVSGEPIKIGVVTSLTGSQANFGQAQKRGYEIALGEINAKGGVDRRKLELVYEDDASKPETAMSATEKLITQDKVPAMMSPYSSAATLAAAGVADKYETPFLVATSAADNITEQGYKWVFRICAPSSVYASTMVDFIADIAKPQTLAIVFENTNFGTSTAGPAKEIAEKKGIKVVAYEAYKAGAPDFKPLITKVKSANPDVVFFVSYLMDATLLMRQSKELDFNPKMYTAGGAGFSMAEFVSESGAGRAAEYTLSVTQWTADAKWPGAKDFDAKFTELYNVAPEYHAAEAYAAVYVMADAIKRAGTLDKTKLRDALANTDMNTAFGPIKFNAQGQNSHPMLITQVQKGTFVTVWPTDAASATPVFPTPPWSQR